MNKIMVTLNGKKVTPNLRDIQRLMDENPDWGRTRLSQELCTLWNWQGPNGQLKDMACRTMLLKLERSGCITLPARQRKSTNAYRNLSCPSLAYSMQAITDTLQSLRPLQIAAIHRNMAEQGLFRCLLSNHHYLGLRNTVGENMKYLIRDRMGRPLSCVLFGSAAWKTEPRDRFIGWDAATRERNLMYLTNNTRFLILPWVTVPHLASHILSQVSHRLSSDWAVKYGHPIYLLETFVERDLRMIKTQQKISGTFRSSAGGNDFCCIRSYISTIRKQAINVIHSIYSIFTGDPIVPCSTNP